MKISFCISCKNRIEQLSSTLMQNLEDNKFLYDYVEFILVDFGSSDGLQNWIISNFQNELSTGYLKYFYTEQLEFWDMSRAKNTAHILASGDILVNLDCDNFTGKGGATYVVEQFKQYGEKLLLHQTSSDPGDGTHGRISLKKKFFYLAGGYNEKFHPMGYQDVDLILRLVRIGLVYTPKCDPNYAKAIRNSKEESVRYINSHKTYVEMCIDNMKISQRDLLNSRLVANENIWGIREGIYQYSQKKLIKLNPIKTTPPTLPIENSKF